MAIHQLHTAIDIDAPAGRVWALLCDFAAYPDWNPFIRSIAGEARTGGRLRITVQPPGGKPMRFAPVVQHAEAGRELRWLGRLLLPGLFDGEHRLLLVPLGPERVRFEHCERFSGLLVGPMRASLDRDTRRGFEEMNRALKARAEALVPAAAA